MPVECLRGREGLQAPNLDRLVLRCGLFKGLGFIGFRVEGLGV